MVEDVYEKNIPEYCSILNSISSIVVKRIGVQPHFHEGHVITLLMLLLKEEAIGRKKLSEKLGIGETSVRSLVKRLLQAGFVKVDRIAGAILTDKGKDLAEKLNELINVKRLGDDYLGFNWNNVVTVILKDTPPESTNVMIIRDKAIALNASAVLIIVIDNGVFIPGIAFDDRLYKEIVSGLEKKLGNLSRYKKATILYAAIREKEPLLVAGYRLGFRILKHYCLRREYC
ncbi:hypothetical protein J4526_00005 [Desulfurococcaceae archaeon MEX13E-LK6-19]|nr:hypothetical protein J4526_00005 [Desulfurococcaceae archaeon MEX13E-LK6-19]